MITMKGEPGMAHVIAGYTLCHSGMEWNGMEWL